jgi:hypothetical protein
VEFPEVRIHGVLRRSPLPAGAGTSGRIRRTRILRDARVPRTPGTAQPAEYRDEGQAAREEHSCHDHHPRGVGGGRQDTVVAHEQRGCLHPQRHTPDDGTRQHHDHRHSGDCGTSQGESEVPLPDPGAPRRPPPHSPPPRPRKPPRPSCRATTHAVASLPSPVRANPSSSRNRSSRAEAPAAVKRYGLRRSP